MKGSSRQSRAAGKSMAQRACNDKGYKGRCQKRTDGGAKGQQKILGFRVDRISLRRESQPKDMPTHVMRV